MPDISEYLDIIANETKGRLVKKAIHDALNVINEAADKRPVAISGVPIDEVLVDTGWITDWQIGVLENGAILKFDGDIDSSAMSGGVNYKSRAGILTTQPGRVFAVTVGESAPQSLTNIEADVDWTLVRTITTDQWVETIRSDAYVLQATYPGATIKGFIYNELELPDPTDSSVRVNDVYVHNSVDALATAYICQEVNSTKTWVDANLMIQDLTVYQPQVMTVWTAVVESGTNIDVYFETTSEYMALGIFAIYDRPGFTASELPFKVSVPYDTGRKFDAYNHLKGKKATIADLPETITLGDIWYVSEVDNCYVGAMDGDDRVWELMGTAYDAQYDTRAYAGATEGIRSNTAKIYIFNSASPNPSQAEPHFKLVNDGGSDMISVAYGLGGGSVMSAWYQSDGSSSFPVFKYENSTNEYANLCDGSCMIFVIEVGSQLGGGS